MNAIRLASLLLVSVFGCYNTVPVGNTTPVAGKELVVQLTDAGSGQLSGALDQTTTQVRGLYLDSSPDTLRLAMIATTLADGEERLWDKEIVGIPRKYIATTGQKVLSPSKSTGVAVLGVVVAIAVKVGFSGFTGTKGKTTGPPTGQ
jgi:hypothetical protein